jgi:hypothetical protein
VLSYYENQDEQERLDGAFKAGGVIRLAVMIIIAVSYTAASYNQLTLAPDSNPTSHGIQSLHNSPH